MAIQLEQRVDVRRIAQNRWRLVGFVGRAMFFYAESGTTEPSFTAKNEFAQGDLGKWRALDNSRHLVVGHNGKATVSPKEGGNPGELTISFDGVMLAL